jgi:hypothetical protein
MSVGSVLIQPQRLERAEAATPDDVGFADVAKLAVGILRDVIGDGHILEQFEAAGVAQAERVLAHAEAGLDHARQRLAALAAAPVARLQTLATELGGISDPAEAFAATHDLLATLTAGAEALTIDHLRADVAELLDVVKTDLRLTPDFLEQEVWAFFDDLVERLEHVAPESDAALRSNRIQVIGSLRRLRRRVGDEFVFPELDPEHAAEDLLALIRKLGVSDLAGRVACVGANLGQATQPAQSLLSAVPFTGLLPSVGAAVMPDPSKSDDEYIWYPSWLANENRAPGDHVLLLVPGDEVRINKAKTQIVQRNTTHGDQLIASGTNLAWKDHPRLGDDPAPYSFGAGIDADAMETLALVTAIMQSAGEVILNAISIEEGDIFANLVNIFGGTLNGLWKLAQKEPEPWWLDGLIFRTLLLFPATFEGIQTEASGRKARMWLTLAVPDYVEMLTWRYFPKLTRDLLLSVITLANNDPSATPHPRNGREFDAVRHVVTLGLENLFLLAFKRKNWGLMKDASSLSPLLELIFLWSLLLGTGVGALGGLVGSLLGEGIARDANADAIKDKMWWSIPQCILTTVYWLFLQQEGSTQSGTFTPSDASPPASAYVGYPPKNTSPYKLPFDPAAVTRCYVPQGNQGLFSHNFNNVNQTYSYDLSLDEGSEILAARSGTVIAFSEGVPNHQDISRWANPTAKLKNAIASGESPDSIEVDYASPFRPIGSLLLGADVASFTSVDGNTFHGVTWQGGQASANHAAGEVVSQKPAKLAGPIALGASPNTIEVDDASGFQPSGSLVIGPHDIAYYTSIAGNVFQGVKWHGGVTADAAVAGDEVKQVLFGWNFIAIQHDVDESLANAGPHAHDLGYGGGTTIVTAAVYGHGMPGSITEAFSTHLPAVPTEAIVGTPVKQGMPIMMAGDTGISFNNHLHMHVIPTPTGDLRLYGGWGDTIPFVFSDEGAPSNGVLKHFTFFKSGNTRRQS